MKISLQCSVFGCVFRLDRFIIGLYVEYGQPSYDNLGIYYMMWNSALVHNENFLVMLSFEVRFYTGQFYC